MTRHRRLSFAIETSSVVSENRPTGIGRYIVALLGGLAELEVNESEEFRMIQLFKGSSSRWKQRHRLQSGARFSLQMWRDGWWPMRAPYDVVHCPDDRIPPWRGPAYVATIHDLFAMIDLDIFPCPEERDRRKQQYQQLVERSHQIICISEHTRLDLLRFTKAEPARAHAIPLGVSPQFRRHSAAELKPALKAHGLNRPYFLFVGAYRPYKNLRRMLEAFAQSGLAHDYDVVLIGSAGASEQIDYKSFINSLGIENSVRQLGYVDESDLPALYAAATTFLFPSLYEGFGLPILEAMASGTAVLTSTAASCPEVASGHAELADPFSVDSIGDGLLRAVAMSDDRRAAAAAYARSKTWRDTAAKTLEIYRLAAQEAPRALRAKR
jgi:glycosyltransferase involved in cell wall biosynthesis